MFPQLLGYEVMYAIDFAASTLAPLLKSFIGLFKPTTTGPMKKLIKIIQKTISFLLKLKKKRNLEKI